MLIDGIDVELNMSFNQKECKEYLKTKIQSNMKNITQFDLLIYLPGGIPFTSGTLNDVFSTYSDPTVKQYIYGVFTRPISDYDLDEIYTNLCDISSIQQKLIFSPICDSTYDGLCNISCLLGYLNYNGKLGDKFHKISSSIIPFPPFSTSLIRLIENDAVTGRDIITITSTLHTYFNHLINMSKSPETIFDYTFKICNFIMNSNEPPNILIQNINLHQINAKPNFWPLTVLRTSQYVNVYFWRGDLNDMEDDFYRLSQIDIDGINDQNSCFSTFESRSCSIIGGKDHCYLFFSEGDIRTGSCKIIDPMTGHEQKFRHFEDFLFSRNFSDKKNVLWNALNSFDKDSIKQMIFICFDKSLLSSLPAYQYLENFVQNSFEYNVPCVEGLIQYSEQSQITSNLNQPIQFLDKSMIKYCTPVVNPHHFDAISFACDELNKNESEYKNAVKRIIVFTSGKKDANSKISFKETACKLLNCKVILDSVILNGTDESKELVTLCHITGGYSINLETIEKGLQLFDHASFINIEERKPNSVMLIEGNRKTKPNYITPSVLTDEFIQNAISMAKFDTDVPNYLLEKVRIERHFASPQHICSINRNYSLPGSRIRRILRELYAVAQVMDRNNDELYDPDVVVLPLHAVLDIWEVFIKGIEGTPYEGKWFYLLVTFPELYPINPPVIQFISVPYHLNVSFEGRVCFGLLNEFYKPSLHIIDIIQNLKEIFLLPAIECPLRIDALETFIKDSNHESYFIEAKKSAEKVGKNDYNEFLPEYSNIADDVDENFELFLEKDRIPYYMRSQISGRAIKDPVLSSTGVYYERDELIELIQSHPNPICVITGKPLTDKLEDLMKH